MNGRKTASRCTPRRTRTSGTAYGVVPTPTTRCCQNIPARRCSWNPRQDDHTLQAASGLNWTDYPVMNMHPHAWPLYSAAKLLGLAFHESGVSFQPTLPLAEYEFTSPLLGFKKSKDSFSGWYAPSVPGRWDIEIQLPGSEAAGLRQLKINGQTERISNSAQGIRFSGESKPGRITALGNHLNCNLPRSRIWARSHAAVRGWLARDGPSRVRSNHFAGHRNGFIAQEE